MLSVVISGSSRQAVKQPCLFIGIIKNWLGCLSFSIFMAPFIRSLMTSCRLCTFISIVSLHRIAIYTAIFNSELNIEVGDHLTSTYTPKTTQKDTSIASFSTFFSWRCPRIATTMNMSVFTLFYFQHWKYHLSSSFHVFKSLPQSVSYLHPIDDSFITNYRLLSGIYDLLISPAVLIM